MISMMYAGLCTLLVIFLALRVVKLRREHGVGLGHGGNMQLLQATRAHANATENMPLALILLSSLELTGYPPAVIHAFGGVFLFSRLLHAWGVSRNEGYSRGRFWGMTLTWLPMIVMAVFAIVGSLSAQVPRFQ
jgi:uncharacterized membrane protein YecN with MAPEG domain